MFLPENKLRIANVRRMPTSGLLQVALHSKPCDGTSRTVRMRIEIDERIAWLLDCPFKSGYTRQNISARQNSDHSPAGSERRFVRSLSLSQSHRNSKHFQALQPEPDRSPIPMFRDCLRMLPIQLRRNPSVFSVASEFLHGVTDLRRPTAYPCVMQVSPAALA